MNKQKNSVDEICHAFNQYTYEYYNDEEWMKTGKSFKEYMQVKHGWTSDQYETNAQIFSEHGNRSIRF